MKKNSSFQRMYHDYDAYDTNFSAENKMERVIKCQYTFSESDHAIMLP